MPVKLQLPLLLPFHRRRRGNTTSLPFKPLRNDAGMDSLTWISQPPNDESKEAKKQRMLSEDAAKRKSDAIDKFLKEQALQEVRDKHGQSTILLLGQAEAGKTTILKQMRILYAPDRHEHHRASWGLVIHLNVIASVRLLLDVHEALAERDNEHRRKQELGAESSPTWPPKRPQDPVLLARLRLAPLIACETALRRALGAMDEDQYVEEKVPSASRIGTPGRRQSPGSSAVRARSGITLSFDALRLKAGWQSRALPVGVNNRKIRAQEIIQRDGVNVAGVRAVTSSGAKRLVRRDSLPLCGEGESSSRIGHALGSGLHSPVEGLSADEDFPEDQYSRVPTYDGQRTESMLFSMRDDVRALWERENIRQLKAKGRLPSFMVHFLDHIHRIASPSYRPTDQDILQARVRTVGITEETFLVKHNTYRVIDVGGSRCQRNVWTSFFEEATAIILLAPISAFDQTLTENRGINRLVDSLDILESIVDCKLLARVSLILFLNKSDICERKLVQGVQVNKFFPEYTGSNDFEQVWRWFRTKFQEVVDKHRHLAPNRSCYVHTTVATSTKNIRAILVSVNDAIIRENLTGIGVM